MAVATLLLPERARLAAAALTGEVARAFGRAERERLESGSEAQLRRHFALPPGHWPVAALTRQLDAGDAGDGVWLRADPAYVVPDMQGARLMAHGDMLAIDAIDLAALLPSLQELFAESGLALDAPEPSRWYLRLDPGSVLPEFAAPAQVLGADLFDHLPQGEGGRRWRALLTEAQVLLHQHPWNRERGARGQPAINSLWFWGGGALPATVTSAHAQVRSREPLLRALTQAAGIDAEQAPRVDALVDLRQLRAPEQFVGEVMQPLLEALRLGELQHLLLDFEDGVRFRIQREQRWRFWRRPLARLDA
ncbi:phosphoglycerate mutase [Xanthomonas hyacinthi]|uniref:Phosphoglycerate mutase n=1 Tax=Xanthomonas hyacinthi TaxID=56455 RepID=A0A2S7EQ93_9XANT|nr:phosphoglycerate mutase [Xanthomonas hyacinthi]KLD75345.1 phosphoglycerate mutase [Xanthomonas hyacinthi DSM 19077]PPU95292.1 phosphoglycerate mutase [Xanthomonas hyacinthi]QGY78607.1 phosphoglycerate mutase [Xanthomonas hyacinthi]